MSKTIQDLAREMADAFERDNRDNGDTFVKLRQGSPDWMTDVVRAAHGDMLPDDYRYLMVEAACDAIVDAGEDADLDDVEIEFSDDVEVYNHALLHWLASNLTRSFYVDDVVEELGWQRDLFTTLQYAQARERAEVFAEVRAALEERAEDEEDDDERLHNAIQDGDEDAVEDIISDAMDS